MIRRALDRIYRTWSLDAFRAPGMDRLPRCPVVECGAPLRPGQVRYLPDGSIVCADHLTSTPREDS